MNVIFSHVKKNYGSITALKDISFEIGSGDFVFIVGPSGSGKSTILKLILNQTKISSGEIIIDSQNYKNRNKAIIENIRKRMGVIFQDYQLINDKTVEENIALALDINNYPENKISSRIDYVINLVNLNSRRHLFPSQLSGGELQRASLARAIAINPKMILADEPTGNLDVENSWNLIKLIKQINEQLQATIIMTTHNLDIVQSMDKRIITISDGLIIKDTNQKPVNNHKKQK